MNPEHHALYGYNRLAVVRQLKYSQKMEKIGFKLDEHESLINFLSRLVTPLARIPEPLRFVQFGLCDQKYS